MAAGCAVGGKSGRSGFCVRCFGGGDPARHHRHQEQEQRQRHHRVRRAAVVVKYLYEKRVLSHHLNLVPSFCFYSTAAAAVLNLLNLAISP